MITTVILDSGHVLAKPATGNWFLPPNTPNIVPISFLKKMSEDTDTVKREFAKAWLPLEENHFIRTEDEEFVQFTGFYCELLSLLGYDGDLTAASTALARDMVWNDDKFVFFEDVDSSLQALKSSYRIGLLSDTWPSLKRVFINKGLYEYFDSFTMSCDYGITKESTRLFEIALEELGIEAEQAVFVDDSEENLVNAEKVGLRPILMNRYSKKVESNYPVVTGLEELSELLKEFNCLPLS